MHLPISSVALWCKWVPKLPFWGQVARNNKHTLIMTEYGSDFLVDWGPRDTFLDPIFAQEHDAHISFGHSARVQQPAPARGWLPGRLPGRQLARAHASNRNRRAHPARSQNSDRACTQSVGFMHARVDGWPRMRWYGLDCPDGASCPICLRNLLRANSSAPTSTS